MYILVCINIGFINHMVNIYGNKIAKKTISKFIKLKIAFNVWLSALILVASLVLVPTSYST